MDAAAGFEDVVDGAERLKADLKLEDGDGEETLVVGCTGGGAGDAKPAKSSSAKKSCEATAVGLDGAVDGWLNARSGPLEGFRGGRA